MHENTEDTKTIANTVLCNDNDVSSSEDFVQVGSKRKSSVSEETSKTPVVSTSNADSTGSGKKKKSEINDTPRNKTPKSDTKPSLDKEFVVTKKGKKITPTRMTLRKRKT